MKQLGEDRAVRLVPIWLALSVTLGTAIGLLVLLSIGTLAMLGWPMPEKTKPATLTNLINILKLVFALVGGLGAIVALVMNYRKQRLTEAKEERDNAKSFNERFASASTALGNTAAAVRLASVHAIAGLADDWVGQRQTCIDVLCSYLRMPYEPDSTSDKHQVGEKEVRLTIIRVIRDHLRKGAVVSWQGHDFDFTGAVFDGGDFTEAHFAGGEVIFHRVQFVSGKVFFHRARFDGATVSFDGAWFSGSEVSFEGASFDSGKVSFNGIWFSDGDLTFDGAWFSGSRVSFDRAGFSEGQLSFDGAWFSDSKVTFYAVGFSGGDVSFDRAAFSGGELSFDRAGFSGGEVSFHEAGFTGGRVDLASVFQYDVPPLFDDFEQVPAGLLLPAVEAEETEGPAEPGG